MGEWWGREGRGEGVGCHGNLSVVRLEWAGLAKHRLTCACTHSL